LASISAFAQSTVAITGNIDLGYRSLKETADGRAAGESVTRKQVGPVGNGAAGWTSSALKLTVSEDMGGGMKAGYVGEMNMSSFGGGTDNANQLMATGRQSYAFMTTSVGDLRLGYQYSTDDQIQGGIGRATPTGNVGGRFQNFALTASAGTNLIATPVASDAVTRVNTFEWSKQVATGLKAIVQYGKQTDETTSAGATDLTKANGTWTGLAAAYNAGPLNLGVSLATLKTDTQTLGGAAQAGNNRTLKTYAANYDFGAVKAFANYTDRTNQASASDVDTTKQKTKGYDLGLSAPMGKTTLFAAMGKGSLKIANAAGTDTTNWGVKTQLLGATYDFSKRTSLNAYYAVTKGSDDLTGGTQELKRTNIGAGLRHQF
jgi:predicted porin